MQSRDVINAAHSENGKKKRDKKIKERKRHIEDVLAQCP